MSAQVYLHLILIIILSVGLIVGPTSAKAIDPVWTFPFGYDMAANEGHVNEWIHWCAQNVKPCFYDIVNGTYPDKQSVSDVMAKWQQPINEAVSLNPGQSSAFNTGFSQGYLGLPLKGYHSKQFLLGYINGTQWILNDKANIAGYLGKKGFVNNESLTYYYQGMWLRTLVKCDANAPLGTFPDSSNDDYKDFWMGYNNGEALRDNSDPSGNYPHFGDCPSGQTREYCFGWTMGWDTYEALINPPDQDNCPGADAAFDKYEHLLNPALTSQKMTSPNGTMTMRPNGTMTTSQGNLSAT